MREGEGSVGEWCSVFIALRRDVSLEAAEEHLSLTSSLLLLLLTTNVHSRSCPLRVLTAASLLSPMRLLPLT